MRSLALFLAVGAVHFVLSVAGILATLPAAFDTQPGFWAAPGKAKLAWVLAWTAGILLAPLGWANPWLPPRAGFAYTEIAVVSASFGVAAVGLLRLGRVLRRRAGGGSSPAR